MKELLYRPSWQALRVQRTASWTKGGPYSVRHTVNLFRYYVQGERQFATGLRDESASMGWELHHEETVRVFRVITELNTWTSRVQEDRQDAIFQFRDELQAKQTVNYYKYLTFAVQRWDWEVVHRELLNLRTLKPFLFRNIQYDLVHGQPYTSDFHKEREHFVEIMDRVKGE